MLRLETRRDADQPAEAADQEARSCKQKHRERELRYYQTLPQVTACCRGRTATASFVQRFTQIRSRHVPRWRKAEQHTCQERNAECKSENDKVEPYFIHSRSIGGHKGSKYIESPVRKRET